MRKFLIACLVALVPFMANATFITDGPDDPPGGGSGPVAKYWVANGGNTSDATNHWSDSPGGAPGAAAPTSSDDCFFDPSSITLPGQTITMDATFTCKSMSWVGVANNPTFDLTTRILDLYGSLTFVSGMSVTFSTGQIVLSASSGSWTITTAGKTMPTTTMYWANGSTLTLQDSFTSSSWIDVEGGVFVTNNQAVTATELRANNLGEPRTITLGSSVVTLTGANGVNMTNVSGLTFNADTSTIRTSRLILGGALTFYNVTLTSAGTNNLGLVNNTYNVLTVENPGATVTGNSSHTVNTLVANGTSGNLITINGPDFVSANNQTVNYVSLQNSAASGGGVFRAYNSTDVSGNSGWTFPSGDPPVQVFHTPTTFRSSTAFM